MRIRTFIFTASAVVALVFFGGSYLAVGKIFSGAVRDNALKTSESVARITFGAMYELMSSGWRREQAESFLRATHDASNDSMMKIQIYRGALVEDALWAWQDVMGSFDWKAHPMRFVELRDHLSALWQLIAIAHSAGAVEYKPQPWLPKFCGGSDHFARLMRQLDAPPL